MKKTVSSLMILTASIAMANDLYMGLEYGMAGNTHKYTGSSNFNDNTQVDNDYGEFKIKLGYGKDADIKIQTYFSLINYDEGVFDSSNEALYEFGLELVKEFTFNKDFYPFVKGGAGVGFMDINGYSEAQANEVSANIGLGLSYKLYEDVSLLGGVDFIYRRWSSVYENTQQKNVQDDALKLYFGANYTF